MALSLQTFGSHVKNSKNSHVKLPTGVHHTELVIRYVWTFDNDCE